MEFGFISIDWDNKKLKTIAEKLLSSGFTWMEIHYPKYTDGDDFFREYLNINRYLIKKYNPKISLHLPAGDINPASLNLGIRKESLKQLKESIEFGENIGTSLLVMHSGEIRALDFPDYTKKKGFIEFEDITEFKDLDLSMFENVMHSINKVIEQALKLNTDAINECASYAKEKGMKLTIENIFSREALIRTPQQAKKFLKDINNSNVYFTLDVGHAYRAGIEPKEFIETLGNKIIHLHLNDNDGKCDYHLPLGKGSIDYIPILKSLNKIDYKGAFIFEISSNKVKDFIDSKFFLEDLMT